MKESLSDIMEIQLDFLNDFYPEIKRFTRTYNEHNKS